MDANVVIDDPSLLLRSDSFAVGDGHLGRYRRRKAQQIAIEAVGIKETEVPRRAYRSPLDPARTGSGRDACQAGLARVASGG
jgi:hypothetical protein